MPTFALNFSRPGAQVAAQYYIFLRLGFEGFKRVQGYSREVATRLAEEIEKLGPFELLTRGDALPVFAFKMKDDIENYTVFDVSNAIRSRGWQLPAYTFPANRTDLAALRVVVRRGFTHDMADLLIADLKREIALLEKQPGRPHERQLDELPPLRTRGGPSPEVKGGAGGSCHERGQSSSGAGCRAGRWPYHASGVSI